MVSRRKQKEFTYAKSDTHPLWVVEYRGDMIFLRTPLPTRLNDLYRFNRRTGAKFKVTEAVQFENSCKLLLRSQIDEIIDVPIIMGGIAYFYDKRQDVDSVQKLIGDALEDVLYVDDKQIAAVTYIKAYDRKSPRLELFVLRQTQLEENLLQVAKAMVKTLS